MGTILSFLPLVLALRTLLVSKTNILILILVIALISWRTDSKTQKRSPKYAGFYTPFTLTPGDDEKVFLAS